MTDNIAIITWTKKISNFSEHYNVIYYRITADILHAAVHVARTVKDQTFFDNFTLSIILTFSGRSDIEGVMFITAEMSTFLHIRSCV
jgi:hypothetical protein